MIQTTMQTLPQNPPETTNARRDEMSRYCEALYRRVRQSQNGSAPVPQAIGVTSCAAGAGVSTVAVNLAVSAAAASDAPVLLIDGNTRDPDVAQTFEIDSSPGFIHALSKTVAPLECVQQTQVSNLWVLPAGTEFGDDGLDVDPDEAARVLEDLKRRFRTIVVDLPTAHDLTSCFALAGALDGVLLVVEAERTDGELAQQTKRQLDRAHAKVLGVVLNKARRS